MLNTKWKHDNINMHINTVHIPYGRIIQNSIPYKTDLRSLSYIL